MISNNTYTSYNIMILTKRALKYNSAGPDKFKP